MDSEWKTEKEKSLRPLIAFSFLHGVIPLAIVSKRNVRQNWRIYI